MAKINFQNDIQLINKELADINERLLMQNNTVLALQNELKTVRRTGRISKKEEQKKQDLLDLALNDQKNLKSQLEATNKRLRDFLDRNVFEKLKTPQQQVGELNDAFPILMFPVRLETRFKSTDGKAQLWVRVYPDDCNVVKREIFISKQEYENTKRFWIEMMKANGSEDLEKGAWKVLVNNHGVNRAEWLVTKYKPLDAVPSNSSSTDATLIIVNEDGTLKPLDKVLERYWIGYYKAKGQVEEVRKLLSQAAKESGVKETEYEAIVEQYRPINIDELIAAHSDGNVEIKILNLPDKNELGISEQSWNSPPEAVYLPDKFVAITYHGRSVRTHVFTKSVSKQLHTGIDPSQVNSITKNDELDIKLNPQLEWMTDFDEAVNAGMAVKIDLVGNEVTQGFDKLLVVGVRISSDTDTSRQELENLIQTHHLSDEGFAFLKQGTPTNNTEDENSGYSSEEDSDTSYDRIFKGKNRFRINTSLNQKADGQRFADYLGINPEVLQTIENANSTDGHEASMMNQALFPATMGYFMDEMLDTFSSSQINFTKNFFNKYVSGRGPIPAFRIGKQPYSILPITVLSKLKFAPIRISGRTSPVNENYYNLQNVLKKLDAIWQSQLSKVSYIGKSGDDHQILLDVLGLHPNSVEFRQRFADGVDPMYNLLAMQAMNADVANTFFTYVLKESTELMKQLEIPNADIIPSILLKYFKPQSNLLNGPLIDDVPLSEVNPIRGYTADNKNYINWLINSSAETIRLHRFGAGKERPKAMLYILLHHALMLAQSASATNFLINNKVIKHKSQVKDKEFINVKNVQETQISKYQALFNTHAIPSLKGSNVIDHLYKKEVISSLTDAKELREALEALRALENIPTARLERLLIEHLDCCNYRLDAWQTGLVNAKVDEEVRSKNARGLYLGAYGVLLNLKPKPRSLKAHNIARPAYRADRIVNASYQEDPSNLGYIHAPSLDQAVTSAVLRNAYDAYPDKSKPNPYAINLNSERVRLATHVLDGIRNGQTLSSLLGYQFERGLHDLYESSNIEADKFIYPLRLVFPILNNKIPETKTSASDIAATIESGNARESIQAQNVIDGLQLIKHYQKSANKNYPFGLNTYKLPAANAAEAAAIKNQIEHVMEIYDAISDLVVAESMYQVVKGNYERAAAITNAFSKGTFPPEIEFIKTSRSGVTMTHKLAVHFDVNAPSDSSPNSIALMTPRAQFEPGVNKWISELLPAPEDVVCVVAFTNNSGNKDELFVSQLDLNLQSLDLLFSANLDSEQSMTELDDRLLEFVKYKSSQSSNVGPFTKCEIIYDVPRTRMSNHQVSFFELSAILKSLRHILIGEKSIKPEDLLNQENNNQSLVSYDTAQLTQKINTIKTTLDQHQIIVNTLYSNLSTINKLSDKLSRELEDEILDKAVLNDLVLLFVEELRNTFIFNHGTSALSINMETFLETYVDSQSTINTINTLAAQFKTDYLNGLDEIDNVIKETMLTFNTCAYLDSSQTGTGFMYSLLSHLKEQVFEEIRVFLGRWDSKVTQFNALKTTLNTTTDENSKIQLLQKMEAIVSSEYTDFSQLNAASYQQIVNQKEQLFNQKYNDLNSILTTDYASVRDFVNTIENSLSTIYSVENLSFDSESDSNIPVKLKKNFIQLYEEIGSAVESLKEHISRKIKSYDSDYTSITNVISNAELTKILLSLSKKLTTEYTIILPHIVLDDSLAEDFKEANDCKDDVLEFTKRYNKSIFPVEEWLSGVARVRKNTWNVENIISLSHGFKPSNFTEFSALQFPVKSENRWLALRYIKSTDEQDYNADEEKPYLELREDTLLYTVCQNSDAAGYKQICGILIDSWTESVPLKEETTGIAFHYDQPNSEPPQTMLFMVSPENKGKWDWENIVLGINDTLEMAKKRAVEPSMLASTPYAQLLPTTMFAVAKNGLTVTANLADNLIGNFINK